MNNRIKKKIWKQHIEQIDNNRTVKQIITYQLKCKMNFKRARKTAKMNKLKLILKAKKKLKLKLLSSIDFEIITLHLSVREKRKIPYS